MVLAVDLETIYILQAITLGVLLSLWIGVKYMINIDRKMKVLLSEIQKLTRGIDKDIDEIAEDVDDIEAGLLRKRAAPKKKPKKKSKKK